MARTQIQWKTRDGEWTYHSTQESNVAHELIYHYSERHGERAIFQYRMVSPDSAEALAKPVELPREQRYQGPYAFNNP